MPRSALNIPSIDPTPIFEFFRGSYGTELLTAAIGHFKVFAILNERALSFAELQNRLDLKTRPTVVLLTALRAFGLVEQNDDGHFRLSEMAEQHLVPGAEFEVSDYVGLAAQSPGVLEMVERLRTDRPANSDEGGAAFIFREGIDSAMEQEQSARHFTLALAGRAKNVAPHLAQNLDLSGATKLLDVGGGTGIYSIALLQKNPHLKAVVLDRPEVLKVAAEMRREYGVENRLQLAEGDMFADSYPEGCDAVLLSNILHDWDIPQCRQLVQRCADCLPTGGNLYIHDVFLNDELDGPLPIALYSAALFTLTEGRAYSQAEYREWLEDSGLSPQTMIPTLIHCGVVGAVK